MAKIKQSVPNIFHKTVLFAAKVLSKRYKKGQKNIILKTMNLSRLHCQIKLKDLKFCWSFLCFLKTNTQLLRDRDFEESRGDESKIIGTTTG